MQAYGCQIIAIRCDPGEIPTPAGPCELVQRAIQKPGCQKPGREKEEVDASPFLDFWSGSRSLARGTIVYGARLEYLGPGRPRAGLLPLWYGIFMLALSLVLVVRAVRHFVARHGAPSSWAAFAVSVAFLKHAGFLICFAALTYFMVAVMYRRSRVTAVIVAASVAAGFYLIFPLALGVQLP